LEGRGVGAPDSLVGWMSGVIFAMDFAEKKPVDWGWNDGSDVLLELVLSSIILVIGAGEAGAGGG